jgi:hypothetical protein
MRAPARRAPPRPARPSGPDSLGGASEHAAHQRRPSHVKTKHAHWPQTAIIVLFSLANPARLRTRGDRLKSRGPLTVFQGRDARHDRAGLSWTLDFEQAREFAEHHAVPAIWTGTVATPDVLAYVTRQEEEEILALPERVTGQRRVV